MFFGTCQTLEGGDISSLAWTMNRKGKTLAVTNSMSRELVTGRDLWCQFFFKCVPIFTTIQHEFLHNIVKAAVDLQTTFTMLWRNSLLITEQKHEKRTLICFLQQHLIDYKFMCLSAYWQWELARQWAGENFCRYCIYVKTCMHLTSVIKEMK